MHGIIHYMLHKYVKANHGTEAWAQLLQNIGYENKVYDPTARYPDEEIHQLISAALEMTGAERKALLEDFGRYIVPDLLRVYGVYLKAQWKTMDVLEHTEEVIHATVRIQNPDANPPQLSIQRPESGKVIIDYYSQRKMLALGVGIIKGIAAHFEEDDSIRIEVETEDWLTGKIIVHQEEQP